MIENKRIIITGGLGFIGSHLVEALYKDNDVLVIDDLTTGKYENIRHLENNNNINVIKGSVAKLDLAHIFTGYDYVFHQAAVPSVPRSIKDPAASNEANITGTLNVLIAARDAGIKRVVYASSSSVYGDTPMLPKTEAMPISPQSPYAVTKAAGEMYCKIFSDVYKLPTVSLRYFNVFGPRQDPNSPYAAVIPKFIGSMMRDRPPVIYGDGEQSRDFTYVRHVVDANIRACESDCTGAFNVACGRRITINRLAGMIGSILGKDIKPVHMDQRPGDIKHSLADIKKARSFNYQPRGDFEEELKDTIRSFGTWMN